MNMALQFLQLLFQVEFVTWEEGYKKILAFNVIFFLKEYIQLKKYYIVHKWHTWYVHISIFILHFVPWWVSENELDKVLPYDKILSLSIDTLFCHYLACIKSHRTSLKHASPDVCIYSL